MIVFHVLLLKVIVFTLIVVINYTEANEGTLYSSDPDVEYNTPQFIMSRGFGYETHYVTTKDGYILVLFRIINPYIKPSSRKRVVFLQHGFPYSSDWWLLNSHGSLLNGNYYEYKNIINNCKDSFTRTIGFTLSACGYDVWLGNLRGNPYSVIHKYLNPKKDSKFWEFNIDHFALIDLPAMLEYVLTETNEETLSYIGHSMGTQIMFALQSVDPEFEKIVRPFIALAPVAYVGYTKGMLRLGAPLEPVFRKIPIGVTIPSNVTEFTARYNCGNLIFNGFCANLIFSVNGPDPEELNPDRIPTIISHQFQLTSSWVYAHFAQMVNSKRFQQFDYGQQENIELYGQKDPPQYNLGKITSKHIALFRGLGDYLSDNTDVELLINDLKVPLMDNYIVPHTKWAHLDFQIGISANIFVLPRMLKTLEIYN